MKWSVVLVVLLVAAACSSSGETDTEQAAQTNETPTFQDIPDAAQPPFELLPPTDGDGANVRQGTVFVETVLVTGDQQASVLFAGEPPATRASDRCVEEYQVAVVETPDQIVLTVQAREVANGDTTTSCETGGQQRRLTVDLQAPIGDRTIVDGKDNGERSVHDPANYVWPSALPSGWIVGYRDGSRLGLVSGYLSESDPQDSIVVLAGPIDAASWSMTEATSDPSAQVMSSDVRSTADGSALMIVAETGQRTIAFDEQGIHYRVTATGAVTESMLTSFVGNLAFDSNARALEIPYSAQPTGVAPPVTPVPTTVARDPSIAWSAAESTSDVENFLEALRAGAYEQAAWPAWGNGVLFEGQGADTTGAEFLASACSGGLCDGPYLVRGQPGIIDPETMRASAIVVVTHLASGSQSQMPILTFEGQRIIGNLPPLVADTNDASFRSSLFGDSPPNYVVVERFEAFEVWDGEITSWFTNWHAENATQVEGDIVVGSQGAFLVSDPQQAFDVRCPQLVERSGEVIALDGCVTDAWAMTNVASGEAVDAPVAFPAVGEAQSAWLTERGGTVLTGLRGSEGNTAELASSSGVDVLEGDNAGMVVLSIDGAHVAYVDHGDPAAISHFWSPVVVVRETATGAEVGRWTLDGVVTCLEFAEQWVVACEADDSTLVFGDPEQQALVAINIATDQINTVTTATKVFLPAQS